VFTARYALSPYIKQIRFVFKGLMLQFFKSVLRIFKNYELLCRIPLVCGNVPSNFIYSCADLQLLRAEDFYTIWLLRGTLKVFFSVICVIRILTMKIEKFQLRGNNSVCAGAFDLLRGRAPAQLGGNIWSSWRVVGLFRTYLLINMF
jgi:hypothetical protein